MGIYFAASLEGEMLVLSGMSNVEQMQDNVEYMEWFEPSSKSKWELLQIVNSILKKETVVPCTGLPLLRGWMFEKYRDTGNICYL